MFISRRCDLFRWSTVFRRCRRRHRLPLVHRLPPGGDLLHEHIASSATIFNHCRWERCSSDYRRFSLNPAQRNILPHRQSQLSDLTIKLHITTSLKSITQIWWLYHDNIQRCFHQFNFLNVNHVTNHSSSSLVNRLVADLYR